MPSYDEEIFAEELLSSAREGRVTAEDLERAFWAAAPHMMSLMVAGDSTEEDARAWVRQSVVPLLVQKAGELGLRLAAPGGLRVVS